MRHILSVCAWLCLSSLAIAQPPTGVGARALENPEADQPAPPSEDPPSGTATPRSAEPASTPMGNAAPRPAPQPAPVSPPQPQAAPAPQAAPLQAAPVPQPAPLPPAAAPPAPTPVPTPAVEPPPVQPTPATDTPPSEEPPPETAPGPERAEDVDEGSSSTNSTAPDAPSTNNVFIPVPMDGSEPMFEELRDLENFFVGDGSNRGGLFTLLFGILLAIAASVGLRRLRDLLAPRGLLPAVLAFLHIAARLFVVAMAIAFVARFLPPRATLILLLAFVGFALALGWSSRDVLPDMIAGLVLAFERRIRAGMWISAGDTSGMVESVGVRSTLVRDAQGREVAIPNRNLLSQAVTSDGSHELEQEFLMRLETDAPADRIRLAIRDAILSSPYSAPGADPIILRDPDDAWIWRVRVRLLSMRHAVTFEGELLERSEEMLSAIRDMVDLPHVASVPLVEDETTDTGSD